MSHTHTPDRDDLVLRNGLVVSMDPDVGIRQGCDVAISDGTIVEIGTDLRLDGATDVDASGMIVMPGLIDSHWHMWSSLGRNFIREG